ncbi:MAG: hypothetical protein HQK49_08175 [Oligoflexia bacterium]|nr:hypothetical protein [Oligoflexia bacterium]
MKKNNTHLVIGNRIVFLDIDGVLQRESSQDRFKQDLDKLQSNLATKEQRYAGLDKYDIGAVYYDWDLPSVERLRKLCDVTGAKIVISSSWRQGKTLDNLMLLFKLHKLDIYIIGMTPCLSYEDGSRAEEVEKYLTNSQIPINSFVILDDCHFNFPKKFPQQFIPCPGRFDEESYQKALTFFKQKKEKRKANNVNRENYNNKCS